MIRITPSRSRRAGPLGKADPVPLAGEDRVRLQTLQEWIAPDLVALESEIETLLHSDLTMLEEILSHVSLGHGKRLRPTLVLIAARGEERASADAIFAAACVELIHTATLVHDDFIDEAETRRGLASVNTKWGAAAALITGDYLYTKVFALLTGRGLDECMRSLARATYAMSRAEMMQLEWRRRLDLTVDQYLQVIQNKTASLIESSCEMGAFFHPELNSQHSTLARFGRSVGMAFQIVDDIFDYHGTEEQLGKPVGGDWREGRITLPFIAAWNSASIEERETLRREAESQADPSALWPQVRDFVDRHGGVEASYEAARRFGSEAKRALDTLQVSPQREILSTAADYVLGRLN
jgi:octaprenyl-diphosphate synthase